MDNFKSIVVALLFVCLIGILDTASMQEKISEQKIAVFYNENKKILGFSVQPHGNYLSVREVFKNTPAHKAGILHKDIILSLNNIQISDINHFKNLVNSFSEKDKLIFEVMREGHNQPIYIAMSPAKL